MVVLMDMGKGKTPQKLASAKKRAQKGNATETFTAGPRRLRLPVYRLLRLKRVKYPERLPSVWVLTAQMWRLFWVRRWLFLGIVAVYFVLVMLLVQGLSGGADVGSLKQQLGLGGDVVSQAAAGLTIFATLLVSGQNSSSTDAAPYQLFIGLVISLAVIWAARQILAGQTIRFRDAFYKGMYPLVPFVIVLLVVALQAVPLLIGSWLYTIIFLGGIAATSLEQIIWGVVILVLIVWTLYLWCSSLIALYVVTLPDMTPFKALRSARQLVQYRRGQVFRKILFLPCLVLVVGLAIMLPAIVFVPIIAGWLFLALSLFALVVVHLYMYTLYKALLA